MNKNKIKHDWRKRISQEYDEPWKEVINGFLDMGYSVNQVAKIVGVQRQTLAANGFRSIPQKTKRQKAKELGISEVTYWRWSKNNDFRCTV